MILILAILMVIWGVVFFQTESINAFMLMVAIALILGVTLIIPIGVTFLIKKLKLISY